MAAGGNMKKKGYAAGGVGMKKKMMAVGIIGGGFSMIQGNKNKVEADRMAGDAKIERDRQEKLFNKEKEKYNNMQFKNVYANMENAYEDVTVNQQHAQLQLEEQWQFNRQKEVVSSGFNKQIWIDNLQSLECKWV